MAVNINSGWDLHVSWSGDQNSMYYYTENGAYKVRSWATDYTVEDRGHWYFYTAVNVSAYRTLTVTSTCTPRGASTLYLDLMNTSFSTVISGGNFGSSGTSTKTITFDVSSLSGTHYLCFHASYNNYYGYASQYGRGGGTMVISSATGTERNYTVTLGAGAGISSISPATSNSVAPGGSLNIDATVSSGYQWNTWTGDTSYLKSAATTKANTVTPSANITLTATATGNTYYVKYNKNDSAATGTMANSTHIYGTAKTLTANAFKKTGYSFSGWAISASGNVAFADKASVSGLTTTSGATVNLYAKWKANTYTVAYNANGGLGTMSSVAHTYDTAKTLTKNTFTKEGYMFMGWSTSSSGDVEYKDGESVKNLVTSGTITLYAVWVREGTVRIMVDGVYKIAQIYVYSGGWKLTQPQCYSNGWKPCGG